jgi:hypothetical protein
MAPSFAGAELGASGIRNSSFAPLYSAHAPQPIELAPAVARSFLKDMCAFYAEKNRIKKDEIAARQAWLLNHHLKPPEKKLSILDVREIFLQMKDHA